MRPSLAFLAAVSWALGGCGGNAPVAPAPRLMVPAQGSAEASTEVEIRGERFHPLVRANFQDSRQSAIQDAFRAFLQPAGAGPEARVELLSVRFLSTEALAAVVPPGLGRGVYELLVVSPAGAEGSLADAYRAVTPAENVAAFQFELIPEQRVGVPFTVGLSAVDAVGRVVDGFSGAAALTALSGPVLPAVTPAFALGRTRLQVTMLRTSAADALVATALGISTSSNELRVRPQVAISLAFASFPQTVAAGQCSGPLALEVRTGGGAATTVEQDTAVQLQSGSPDLAFHTTPTCGAPVASLTVPAGEGSARVYFTSPRAGPVTVRAQAAALASALQTQTIAAGAPQRVAFASAPQVVRQGECSPPVRVEAQDGLDNAASPQGPVALSLSSEPAAGISFFSDGLCASPLGPLEIASAAGAVFHYRATSAGAYRLAAAAPSQPSWTSAAQDERVDP